MARNQRLTRYNHTTYILDSVPITKTSILPGHIIEFSYDTVGKTDSDKKPLVFLLYRDLKKKLIHGVNLKYIPEFEVQVLFEEVKKMVPLEQHDMSAKTLNETTTRFQISTVDQKIPTIIYDRIIKPRFLRNNRRDCYRTYSLKKMSAIKAISYKIEGEFRNWKGRDNEN